MKPATAMVVDVVLPQALLLDVESNNKALIGL